MSKCTFIKPNGDRCGGVASGGSGFCWHHDPANANQLRANSAKGGRGKARRQTASDEVVWIKGELDRVYEGALNGTLGSRQAAVCIQALNSRLRSAELTYKLEEQAALEARIDELEAKTGVSK